MAILGGQPLIIHSIEPALLCAQIGEVYINSDSKEILDVGFKAGAKKFKRRVKLAGDHATMREVVVDFVQQLARDGKHPDGVVVMYPTYPFRGADNLTDWAQKFYELGGKRSLIGFKKPETHPYQCFELDELRRPRSILDYEINKYYRRQDYPEFYELTMWVCVVPTATATLLNAQLMDNNTYGYLVPDDAITIDIDTPDDLEFAEYLFKRREGK